MLPEILRRLPYLVHTNRELGLMLKGAKPLAMFVDGLGQFPNAVLRYLRLFDRHVVHGTIIRRDDLTESHPRRDYVKHRVLFGLPAESWRIDAMIELKKSAHWSRDLERREGELLGYEDWMNDHWLGIAYPEAGPPNDSR